MAELVLNSLGHSVHLCVAICMFTIFFVIMVSAVGSSDKGLSQDDLCFGKYPYAIANFALEVICVNISW